MSYLRRACSHQSILVLSKSTLSPFASPVSPRVPRTLTNTLLSLMPSCLPLLGLDHRCLALPHAHPLQLHARTLSYDSPQLHFLPACSSILVAVPICVSLFCSVNMRIRFWCLTRSVTEVVRLTLSQFFPYVSTNHPISGVLMCSPPRRHGDQALCHRPASLADPVTPDLLAVFSYLPTSPSIPLSPCLPIHL